MKTLIYAFLFLLAAALPAQTTNTTTPQPGNVYKDGVVVYAVKANAFWLQLPNYGAGKITAYGIDYSFYVKCDRGALFAGYTPLYSNSAGGPNTLQLNCMNFGFQYQLIKFKKVNSFYLCLYNIHSWQSNADFPARHTNLINFNPKYQVSFLKNIFSVEVGVMVGVAAQKNSNAAIARSYPSHIGLYNLTPQYGFNASLAFNFSALFK